MSQPVVYYEDEAQYQGGYYHDYMDQPQYESPFDIAMPTQQEEFAADGEEEQHLAPGDVWGKERKTFVMKIEGSLDDFAANPSKAVFKLPADAHQFLRRVPTQRNRTNAKKDERAGDLGRAIMLKATITSVKNEFPIDIGLDIPGLVPEELTAYGRHNYVLPAHTPTSFISEDITTPDNVFTEYMYENWRACTPEDLGREIKFPDPADDKEDQDYADIKTNGIAWKTLVTFVQRGLFEGYEDHILHANAQIEVNPLTMRKMSVPVEMARKVYDYLAEPLQDIDKAFVDLTKLHGRFGRADGEPWNSHSSLVGASVAAGDDEGEFSAHQMATPFQALAKVQLEYILY